MQHSFSYWQKSTFLAPRDLVIVGSGIVGLSAAIAFKQAHTDAKVLVLEKGIFPDGASARNAGFACFGSVTELMDDISQHGSDATFKLVEQRYKGLLLLRKELGDKDINFNMCGGYEIFKDSKSFEHACTALGEFNHQLKPITGEPEVYKRTEYNGYPVILNKLEGYLNPALMLTKLISIAREIGIDIWTGCPVSDVRPGWIVLDGGSEIATKKILAATNAYTSKVLPATIIKPARGYVLVTKPLPEVTWRGTFHYDKGYVYYRDLPGRRLLIGGGRNIDPAGEESFELQVNPVVKTYLIEFINRRLQLPDDWGIEYEWSGIMGFAESKQPVIKQVEQGVFVVAGLGGMGIALGMQAGMDAASLIQNTLS